jgi:hypothetical protein
VKPKKERSMFEQVSTFRKTPGEVAAKSIQLSSMFDRFAAETEFLDFLYNLVRLVKPVHSVEMGARNGRSAIAIASALRHNGLGHLVSLEDDPEAARHAMAEIGTAQLEGWVAVVTEQILNFQPRNELQFVLLDSDFGVRRISPPVQKTCIWSDCRFPRQHHPTCRNGGCNHQTDHGRSIGPLLRFSVSPISSKPASSYRFKTGHFYGY